MSPRLHHVPLAGILLALGSATVLAQTSPPQAAPAQTQAGSTDETRPRQQRFRLRVRQHELIYGAQIMTPQEREEYRIRLRSARTDEERTRIRAEHQARMTERAKAQGVTLPEDAPAQPRRTDPGSEQPHD